MKYGRIIYSTIFMFSLIFIYFHGGKLPYMFFYTVLLMPLFSLLHLLYTISFFRYYLELSEKIPRKGETVDLGVNVSNETILPFSYIEICLESNKAIPGFKADKITFWVESFSSIKATQKLCFKNRGEYELGIKSITYVDMLGIFRYTSKDNARVKITIMPRVYKLNALQSTNDLLSDNQTNIFNIYEDTTSFADLRKYKYGDSIKRIHWKMTAKQRDIMVKSFHGTSHEKVSILVDMKAPKVDEELRIVLEDRSIEATLSYGFSALHESLITEINYFDKDQLNVVQASSLAEFDRIFETLALKDFNASLGINELLQEFINNSSSAMTLVVIVSEINTDLLGEILKINSLGVKVNLFIGSENILDSKGEEMVKSLQRSGVKIMWNTDFEDIRIGA